MLSGLNVTKIFQYPDMPEVDYLMVYWLVTLTAVAKVPGSIPGWDRYLSSGLGCCCVISPTRLPSEENMEKTTEYWRWPMSYSGLFLFLRAVRALFFFSSKVFAFPPVWRGAEISKAEIRRDIFSSGKCTEAVKRFQAIK